MSPSVPPKPRSRPDRAGIWARLSAFRQDMFRSQPERLYRAKIARMRTPFYNSFLINDLNYVDQALAFPKARIVGDALQALLGRSIFVTNGADWARSRRIVDPAFEAGQVRRSFDAMQAAGRDAVARLESGRIEMEFEMSYLAADVIFRTLFSIPITHARARRVFEAFQRYQRAQPMLSVGALLRLPMVSAVGRRGGADAAIIRAEIEALVDERLSAARAGEIFDDLAGKLMQTPDPETGERFSRNELIDQVAIFFLAGHETSASAMAWALYCLAQNQEAQEAVRAEVPLGEMSFEDIAALVFTRDVFRETLRLYPPVPVMLREADAMCEMRGMPVAAGDLCMVSPWYIHRHDKNWHDPDAFDPWRWSRGERSAYLPFSKGARVCPGAGFATIEGVLMLALLVRAFRFELSNPAPVPIAHLTVRAQDGIYLKVTRLRE